MMLTKCVLLAAAWAAGDEPAKQPAFSMSAGIFRSGSGDAANCNHCHAGPIAKCPGSQARQHVSWIFLDNNGWVTEGVSDALRAQLKLPASVGLVATQVSEDSPAAKAGIKQNDVLVSLGGKNLEKTSDWNDLVKALKEDAAPCKLLRAGAEQHVTVPLAGFRTKPEKNGSVLFDTRATYPARIGVNLAAVDDALRAQLPELPKGTGVVLNSVEAGMPAAAAGLKPHDIVVKLAKQAVASEEDFKKIVQQHVDQELDVLYFRGGQAAVAKVTPKVPVNVGAWFPETELNTSRIESYWTKVPEVGGKPGDVRQEMQAIQATLGQLQQRLQALDAKLAAPPKPADKKP